MYKILAVDDNPINLKLLRHALIDSDYEICTAQSGSEALEQVAKQKPDLILLDVMMPGMDGYEVCRKLKENKETAGIQVIFLSAKNESIDKTRGLSFGAIDYLTKPFDMMEINARIRSHLNRNERYYHLLEENRQLKDRLEKQKTNEQSGKDLQRLIGLLQKLEQQEAAVEKEKYSLQAYVHSKQNPPTGLFYAVPFDDDGLLFFSFAGLDRGYTTSLLKLMMSRFLQGFSASLRGSEISTVYLNAMVNTLLNAFPDELYEVAYTFTLSYLDMSAGIGYFYLAHQSLPLWIYPKGTYQILEGRVMDFDSPHSSLVKAMKAELPGKGLLFYHQNGLQNLPDDRFEEKILPRLKKNWRKPDKALQIVRKQIIEDEDDHIIAAISIKRA